MNSIKHKAKNFHCPKCNRLTTVTSSKSTFSLGHLRYRECKYCSYSFKTLENNSLETIYPGIRKKSVRFTPKDIKRIRFLSKHGMSLKTIALKFDCSYTTVQRVVNLKVHKNVT